MPTHDYECQPDGDLLCDACLLLCFYEETSRPIPQPHAAR